MVPNTVLLLFEDTWDQSLVIRIEIKSYLHARACGQVLVAQAFSSAPHTRVCRIHQPILLRVSEHFDEFP